MCILWGYVYFQQRPFLLHGLRQIHMYALFNVLLPLVDRFNIALIINYTKFVLFELFIFLHWYLETNQGLLKYVKFKILFFNLYLTSLQIAL